MRFHRLRMAVKKSLGDTIKKTNRLQHKEKHTITTRLSLVLFKYAYLELSAFRYVLFITFGACRFPSALLLVALQHIQRGTLTISLRRVVPERSPISSPSCLRNVLHSRAINRLAHDMVPTVNISINFENSL